MKKLISLSLLFILMSNGLFAQKKGLFRSLKFKKIGASVGIEQDMIIGGNMNANYFNHLSNDPKLGDAFAERSEDLTKSSGMCENPHVRFNLVYETPRQNELHINLIGVFNRVDGLDYHNYNTYYDYEYLYYNLTSNELALETSYIAKKKLNLLPNIFHINLYGGLGTNLGYQFANHLSVGGAQTAPRSTIPGRLADMNDNNNNFSSDYDYDNVESFHNSYNISNAINQRAFVAGGIGVVFFKRLEVGAMARYGYGYRYHFSDDLTTTNIRSLEVNAKWVLK